MLVNEEKYTQLYNTQDKILQVIANENLGFYLTGGTALQRFYFDVYRYSDDLDLFLIENGLHKENAEDFHFFIQALQDYGFSFNITIDSSNFKRNFLDENNLKIDLINDCVFHENDFIKTKHGFFIDSIQNIFANKLETSISRTEPRDLFDIYTILINTEMDIEKSFDLVKKKTNISPQNIKENLKNIDINNVDMGKINFKNESVGKDFSLNFHKVILEKFNLTNTKKHRQ